jgi:tellurite resistance protein
MTHVSAEISWFFFLMGLGGVLLAVTTALIALLVVLTLKAIAAGKVFIPE